MPIAFSPPECMLIESLQVSLISGAMAKRATDADRLVEINRLVAQTAVDFATDALAAVPAPSPATATPEDGHARHEEKASAEGGFFDWAKTSLDGSLPRADVAGIECLSCLPPSREELDARGASSEEVAAVAAAPAAVAAAAPLLSSVETAKVLALAPSALVLLHEGVVEGERRAPYEGLYKLDRGNYVNQRPLFRRVEGGALPGASKRCLAYVAEGKCTWAGQLEASLGSSVAYLQLIDPTLPATPDRSGFPWQGVNWVDALDPEGQWTPRPKLKCSALLEAQAAMWRGIEIEGQLAATGLAIAITGFVDEDEVTFYLMTTIVQAADGKRSEHEAKHRFSRFEHLHTEMQPQLGQLLPARFPVAKLALTGLFTAASKAAAKTKRGKELQAYLRRLASAAASKGLERGGPELLEFLGARPASGPLATPSFAADVERAEGGAANGGAAEGGAAEEGTEMHSPPTPPPETPPPSAPAGGEAVAVADGTYAWSISCLKLVEQVNEAEAEAAAAKNYTGAGKLHEAAQSLTSHSARVHFFEARELALADGRDYAGAEAAAAEAEKVKESLKAEEAAARQLIQLFSARSVE